MKYHQSKSSAKEQRLFTGELNSDDTQIQGRTQTRATMSPALPQSNRGLIGCIDRFGLTILERFHRAITFITLTGTLSTTTYQTLSVLRQRPTEITTSRFLPKKIFAEGESGFWKMLFPPQLIGTARQKAAFGIHNMQKRYGNPAKVPSTFVNIVTKFFYQKHLENTAQTHVNLRQGSKAGSTTRKGRANDAEKGLPLINTPRTDFAPVHVVRVIGESKKQPVYNLQVAGAREYYANGVLVHNCDAARYMIMHLDGGAAGVVTVTRYA
jgi:hypothetical protein